MSISGNALVERLTTSAEFLIAADRVDQFQANLVGLFQHPQYSRFMSQDGEDTFWDGSAWYAAYRPYAVSDGVLTIPIKGSLLNDFPYQVGGMATGYPYLRKVLERGLADPAVKIIVPVINSPGGEVSGNFELADEFYAARKLKTLVAFAADYAYSAAYSLGSAAEKLFVSRTGGVGSVGVATLHVDMSAALEKMGLKVTWIYAGKRKVEGTSTAPLSDEAKSRIQARIDDIYSIFVSTVARNRKLPEDAVRATEAGVFGALAAVAVGFVDGVQSMDSGIGDLKRMAKMTISAEAHEAAVKASKDAGVAEGRSTERARIGAILGSDEAKARPNTARVLALTSDLSADSAKAILTGLPEEVKAAAPAPAPAATPVGNAFERAMAAGNPNVGGPVNNGGDQAVNPVADILGSYRAAGGQTRPATAA